MIELGALLFSALVWSLLGALLAVFVYVLGITLRNLWRRGRWE
ncbi:MAG: hypothetical protein ACE5LS_00675 [Thermoplasmata archaeon]